MAIEIKPFMVGSKKATMGLIGGGIGFAVFIICVKWLGLSVGEALKVAGVIAGFTGGGYGVIEGIRDIRNGG